MALIALTVVVFVVDVLLFAEFSWLEERVRRTRTPVAAADTRKVPETESLKAIKAEAQPLALLSSAHAAAGPHLYSTGLDEDVVELKQQLQELQEQARASAGNACASELRCLGEKIDSLAAARSNDLVEFSALKTEIESLKHALRGLYAKELRGAELARSVFELEESIEKISRAAKKAQKESKRSER
ncbi:MAG: hypothetical protein ACPL4N_00200 [Candidatus Norongarragalinales archaeon]